MTYVDRTLTCVDCGVEFIHSAADQEYYAAEGVRLGPQALRQLPRQPARQPRRRLRRPRHRRTARLRAGRRPARPRVLRGDLLVVRQPGPGAVQAADGPARSTAPTASGRSSRTDPPASAGRPAGARPSEPERLAARKRSRWRPRQTVTRRGRGPATRRRGRRRAVSSSMPSTTEPRGAWRARAPTGLRPRVVVGDDRGARRRTRARPPAQRPGATRTPEVEVRGRPGPSPRPSSRRAPRRARAPRRCAARRALPRRMSIR